MPTHQFGGSWTEEKLQRVSAYLHEYTKIFTKGEKARHFKTVFVDAFAGTGYIEKASLSKIENNNLFPITDPDPEAASFMKGSARVALEVSPPFNKYLFVERDPQYARELQNLKSEFGALASRIEVVERDVNVFLPKWCEETNWNKTRAVVFLDPYGMQVEWSLIEHMARTKAVDLWYLFPAGAINRLLTKSGRPPEEWGEALTRCFGTRDWEQAFYRQNTSQRSLFGDSDQPYKAATFDTIGEFVQNRLKTVFAEVAKNTLWLRNSKNVPLFLLCFAAANPTGATIAVRIANHILGKK